jgi:hypothetical protein
MDRQRAGLACGLFQPEGDEVRELLRPGHAGVDRQPPRRQAVLPFAAHRPEVAGTQEGRHVALQVGVEVDAKAGKAQVRRQAVRRHAAVPVVEQGRVVSNLLGLPLHHLEHAHR